MTGNPVVADVECYENYFLVTLKEIGTGRCAVFERHSDFQINPERDFDAAKLERMLRRNQIITFNGIGYDAPMLWLAIDGATCSQLKEASNRIISGGMKPWEFERFYNIRNPKIDHIDLIEVAPGQASLKIYGGRVHSRRMQDLPIEHDEILTEEQKAEIRLYNINDLDTTIDLWRKLAPQLELREKMSRRYGIDLRSKSDAQIAEAVIKLEIEKLQGKAPRRPEIPPGTKFKYQPPAYLKFRTPLMQEMFEKICAADFTLKKNGSVEEPDVLAKAVVSFDGIGKYRMGIGGLHSSEETVAHVATDDLYLIDRDVASYYPNLILTNRWFPKHIGEDFLRVYQGIVDDRLSAKARAKVLKKQRDAMEQALAQLLADIITAETEADSGKIIVNGSFGKLGSMWSALYSPNLMIQVTLTGQLALLMLIERLWMLGFEVVSANTDGIVTKVPKDRYDEFNQVIAGWERATRLETEETRYAALYSRDVNNYIAVKEGGKSVKTKGAFADSGLQKNPTNEICIAAIKKLVTEGTPICDTIRACDDVRQFVTVRQVKGGAIWRERYLGKAIRWYYGPSRRDAIHYKIPNQKGNHNKVPKSDGAIPLMDLPDSFPRNVNRAWYINETASILRDIGYRGRTGDPIVDMIG